MSNTPSDAEISAVIAAAKVKCVHPEAETTIDIARAVLAKWGAPQPVVRGPLPMPDLAQLTDRGAEAWAGVDAQALRVGREPLTREQVKAIMAEAGYDREAPQPRADFISGLRHGERAHGITAQGGAGGGNGL